MGTPPRRSSGIVRLPHCSVPSGHGPAHARVDPRSPTGGPCGPGRPAPGTRRRRPRGDRARGRVPRRPPRDDARRRTDRRPGRCRAGDRSPRRGSRRCARRLVGRPHAGSSVVPTGWTAGTSAVPDAALPSVSVVVSTIVTRLADIARLLDHLAALDYPSYEVVVVDNRVAVPAEDPLPGLLAGTTCDSSSSVARAVPPDGTPVSRRPRARSSPSRTTTSASTRGGSG